MRVPAVVLKEIQWVELGEGAEGHTEVELERVLEELQVFSLERSKE